MLENTLGEYANLNGTDALRIEFSFEEEIAPVDNMVSSLYIALAALSLSGLEKFYNILDRKTRVHSGCRSTGSRG